MQGAESLTLGGQKDMCFVFPKILLTILSSEGKGWKGGIGYYSTCFLGMKLMIEMTQASY